MGHFPYFNHLFAENIIRGGGQKRRKSAEKGHFIPFFSILKGPEGRRGFNSAISYITTVISTCIIHKHRAFDLFFSSSFDKVVTILIIYDSIATVGEIRVYRRADFQSGSRVLKKVF